MDQVHEDDAEHAVAAGWRCATRPPSPVLLWASVSTAVAYYVAADAAAPALLGPVVNLAVRLRYQAAAGEILLSHTTYDLARRGVRAMLRRR